MSRPIPPSARESSRTILPSSCSVVAPFNEPAILESHFSYLLTAVNEIVMAPLASNSLSSDAPQGEASGLSQAEIVRIVVAIVLFATVLLVLWLFWSSRYRCCAERCKHATSPSVSNGAVSPWRVTRGGTTHPTASLPRFARHAGDVLHDKASLEEVRFPVASRRAQPTAMLGSHNRRSSEASSNSRVGLLRSPSSSPSSPKPAFLGNRVTAMLRA
ncbi:hypothetical protein BD311DRAFT_770506 [Dichomitus squalens]|uniref:Uncharacterized protein n=1 Tax=Dichomitus squalens TaxID=114155 RepID=A0A4Q9M9H9_9APHY|nr:hypothetical protein BD311DRAFT_770506 [Dichomitus squalens]